MCCVWPNREVELLSPCGLQKILSLRNLTLNFACFDFHFALFECAYALAFLSRRNNEFNFSFFNKKPQLRDSGYFRETRDILKLCSVKE